MTVSVIIPCHNAEGFLGATIESVLNQTCRPDEVIVVDNGSTDDSVAVARSFGEAVTLLSEDEPGASAARNRGMAAASGDAVMFLDADDLLGPRTLECLGSTLAAAPDAIACCPWYRLEEAGGCWHSAPASCLPRRAGLDDLGAWLTGWYHPPCSVLWSRTAYARSGGWDPRVRVNNDGDIMMRGFVAGNRLVHARDGAAYYRRLPAGRVSLSGTRATRTGIESRLFVLRRIARMLRGQHRIRRYRGTLAEAFARVADDATGHPDLQAECEAEMREQSGPAWLRPVARMRTRAGRKLGHLRQRLYLALGPPPDAGRTAAGAGDDRPAGVTNAAAAGYRPKVSVVIPTYNRCDVLPRAIDSALAQTYENIEVLVVDDGSTDDTPALMSGYRDPRLRYLVQDRNRGVGAARNRGIREAAGSLLAFLDSDDEWLPEKLSRQVAVFAGRPQSLGLVYSGVETVDLNDRRKVDLPVLRGDMHAQLLQRNALIGGSSAMIRRSVIATVGYIDESLPAIEDYDFWLRIARFYEFDFVAAPLVRYFDCVTGDRDRDARRRSLDFAANFQARQTFYERNRHEMAQARVEHLFMLESAKRHLRWPFGDPRLGRRILLEAFAARPLATELYPWLVYALLPARARPWAAAARRQAAGGFAGLKRGGMTQRTG